MPGSQDENCRQSTGRERLEIITLLQLVCWELALSVIVTAPRLAKCKLGTRYLRHLLIWSVSESQSDLSILQIANQPDLSDRMPTQNDHQGQPWCDMFFWTVGVADLRAMNR